MLELLKFLLRIKMQWHFVGSLNKDQSMCRHRLAPSRDVSSTSWCVQLRPRSHLSWTDLFIHFYKRNYLDCRLSPSLVPTVLFIPISSSHVKHLVTFNVGSNFVSVPLMAVNLRACKASLAVNVTHGLLGHLTFQMNVIGRCQLIVCVFYRPRAKHALVSLTISVRNIY